DLEDQPVRAGLAARLRHAHRPRPADLRDLVGLVRPEVRPGRRDLGARLRRPGQVDLVAPAQVGCIPLPQVRSGGEPYRSIDAWTGPKIAKRKTHQFSGCGQGSVRLLPTAGPVARPLPAITTPVIFLRLS